MDEPLAGSSSASFCLFVSIRKVALFFLWRVFRQMTGLFGKARHYTRGSPEFYKAMNGPLLVIAGKECDYRVSTTREAQRGGGRSGGEG